MLDSCCENTVISSVGMSLQCVAAGMVWQLASRMGEGGGCPVQHLYCQAATEGESLNKPFTYIYENSVPYSTDERLYNVHFEQQPSKVLRVNCSDSLNLILLNGSCPSLV